MSQNYTAIMHDAFFEEQVLKAVSKLKLGVSQKVEKRKALINSLEEIKKVKKYDFKVSDQTKLWKINAILNRCSTATIYQTGHLLADRIHQMTEEEIDQIYRHLEMLVKY